MKFQQIMEFIPHTSLATALRDYYSSKQEPFVKLFNTYCLVSTSTAATASELEAEMSNLSLDDYIPFNEINSKGVVLANGDIVSLQQIAQQTYDYNTFIEDNDDYSIDKSSFGSIKSINDEIVSLTDVDSVMSETYMTNSVIQDVLTQFGNLDIEDTSISMADMSAVLSSKYDVSNPNVSNIIYSVLNIISMRGASIKQKIESILTLLNPTVSGANKITFTTLEGEFTGISPAAAWAASLNLDFSGVASSIVSVVKATVSVVTSVFSSVIGFLGKGLIKMAEASFISKDIKKVSGKRNLLYVPYKQGFVSLWDVYQGNRSRTHFCSMSTSYYGNIASILPELGFADYSSFKEYIWSKLSETSFLEIDYGFAVMRLFRYDNERIGYMWFVGLIGQGRDFMEQQQTLTLRKHYINANGVDYVYLAPSASVANPAVFNIGLYDPNEEITEIKDNEEGYTMIRNSVFLLHNLLFHSLTAFDGDLRSHFANIAEFNGGFFNPDTFTDITIDDYLLDSGLAYSLPFKVYREHYNSSNVVYLEHPYKDFYGPWISNPTTPINNMVYVQDLEATPTGTTYPVVTGTISMILTKLCTTRSSSQGSQFARTHNSETVMLYNTGIIGEIDAKWNICTDIDNKEKFSNLLKIVGSAALIVGLAVMGLKIVKNLKTSFLATNASYQNNLRILGSMDPTDPDFKNQVSTTYKMGASINRKQSLFNMLGIKTLGSSGSSPAGSGGILAAIPAPGLNNVTSDISEVDDKIQILINNIGL